MAYQVMKSGRSLSKPIHGFPFFYRSEKKSLVITADIWSFLNHSIKESKVSVVQKAHCYAFISQAHDFFKAANTSAPSSQALLYYYAFMNLGKVMAAFDGTVLPNPIPHKLFHGISDPKVSNVIRRPSSQEITLDNQSAKRDLLFPALIEMYRTPSTTTAGKVKVVDLLSEVPAIHRTFGTVFKTRNTMFCPVDRIELLTDGSYCWCVIYLIKSDQDVKKTFRRTVSKHSFKSFFRRVKTGDADMDQKYYVFESTLASATTIEQSISELASAFRNIGIWCIATSKGYRPYLSAHITWLPQFCSSYAVMFYWGSITRYVPFVHDQWEATYYWILSEFLATQPSQMLYYLASWLAETEVVVPYALHDK